jgi:hygromycin-B 4-O-kinase
MKPLLDHKEILKVAGNLLNQKIAKQELAVEGADHIVFKAWLGDGEIVIIKTGPDAAADGYVLNLLKDTGIKVPRLLAQTQIDHQGNQYGLIVMSCFQGQMLKTIPKEENYKYIKSIIEEISKVHKITSPGMAGYVLKVAKREGWTWKHFLLRPFLGEDPYFDWEKIYKHPKINKAVIQKAIEIGKTNIHDLPEKISLNLVNTDLNQSNIFIKNNQLEGIIDWSDAVYGDPLFDFARLRMNIKHRMDEKALKEYYDTLNLSKEQKKVEEVYYLLHLLMYVAHFVDYGWDDLVGLQVKMVDEVISNIN